MKEAVVNLLKGLPYGLVIVVVLAYALFDFYQFSYTSTSLRSQKTSQIVNLTNSIESLKKDVKKAEDFQASNKSIKQEIQLKASELEQMQVELTETIDIAEFLRMISTEAKRIGIRVTSLRPGREKLDEFYVSKAVELKYEGVFVQLMVFLKRLSDVRKIVRVDDFQIEVKGDPSGQLVPLQGRMDIQMFKYRVTSEDELMEKGAKRGG